MNLKGGNMARHLVKLKDLHLCVLLLCLSFAISSANATPVDSIDQFLAYDTSGVSTYLLNRVPSILMQLRRSAESDEKLKRQIGRIRVSAPSRSYYELYPNAFAKPGESQDFIVIEARFVNQIAAQAAAGALFATGWKDVPAIFERFCADYQHTYRQVVREGKGIAVYQLVFDDYLGKQKNVDRLLIDKLHAIVAEETMVWFILHEVGHLVLGHDPNEPITKAKSREREEAADRWASLAMKKLGYGLFGISQHLNGRAATESCLTELGLVTPESQSTHPSFTTRFRNMKSEFKITHAPGGDPRLFFMPVMTTLPIEMYLVVPSPDSDDYRVTINQNYNVIQGVCEWNGNTAHIYTRSNTGGRMEFIIPNASYVYNRIIWREYDPTNSLVNATEWRSFQQNTSSFDYLQVGGGLTFEDIRARGRIHGAAVFHLRRVGTPEDTIPKVLRAIKEFESAEKKIIVAYMKGEIGFAGLKPRITPVMNKYRNDFIKFLGVDRYNRYRESSMGDPLMKWVPGSGADYKALEDELIEKFFPSKKSKPIYEEKDRRLTPKVKAVPGPPDEGLLPEAELLAVAKRAMKARRIVEAKSLLTKGANAGYTGAQYDLGMLLIVLGQRDTGLYWLEQASQQGHQEAIEALRSLRGMQDKE